MSSFVLMLFGNSVDKAINIAITSQRVNKQDLNSVI
jgi:hypothetical protein